MKLGKCKQALADLINANGGWVDGEAIFAAMDGNGDLFGYSGRPQWTASHGHWYGHTLTCWFFSPIVINNHHQTILSCEEYYQAYPKADADGWIEWNGGECPVENGLMVDIRVRDGREERNLAANTPTEGRIPDASCAFWKNDGMAGDIIAYRLHKPEVKPEVKPELCESVMRSIPEPEAEGVQSRLDDALAIVKVAAPHLLNEKYKFDGDEVMGERKPSIEQLAQDYRNKLDYSSRKQQEADDAKAAADAALVELERAGEALGLLIGIANPDRGPELVITDWRDLRVNDVIFVDEYDGHESGEYVVVSLEDDDYDGDYAVMATGIDGRNRWIDTTVEWRLIRRP